MLIMRDTKLLEKHSNKLAQSKKEKEDLKTKLLNQDEKTK